MSEQELTKKERKELKKQEAAEAKKRAEAEARAKTVRTWTIVVIAAVVIVGFLAWLVQNAPERGDFLDDTPELINPVTDNDNKKGASDEDAKLTIIEYSDFECPACGQYYPILKQLTETYGDDGLQFVYRHLPIQHIHPNAALAARYAEAAGRQGMFFEMHDLIFENQGTWRGAGARLAENTFLDIGEQLGLDLEQLEIDADDPEIIAKVEEQRIDAVGAGANSTPTFVVNGEIIQNPRTFVEFEQFIQSELGLTGTQIDPPSLQLNGADVETESGADAMMEVEGSHSN